MEYLQAGEVLICKKGDKSLSINCMIPQIDPPEILPDNIGIAYFYSPYFSAASNYFSIKVRDDHNQEVYWGMLYPMELFDKDNSALYEDLKKFQISMLFSAFCSFVELAVNFEKIDFEAHVDYYEYSDFSAEDSVFVFIYDKSVYADFSNVIGAFYNCGFYFLDNPYVIDRYYKSEYQKSIYESQTVPKCFLLGKYSSIFDGFGYLEIMYKQLLPRIDSPLFVSSHFRPSCIPL